jgi:hypothetical protein
MSDKTTTFVPLKGDALRLVETLEKENARLKSELSSIAGRLEAAEKLLFEANERIVNDAIAFQTYAENHRRKGTPEAYQKANVNQALADRCAAMIDKLRPYAALSPKEKKT